MRMSPRNREELDRLNAFLTANTSSLPAINQVAMLLQQKAYPMTGAFEAYASYLELHPSSADAAFNRAWYLTRDGQFESAIQGYHQALELGISQPEEAHLNIGNIYMDHLGDFEKAKTEFKQALKINPRYVGAYHNLANLAEQSGEREQAAALFEKCLEIEPGNETELARLADTQKFTENDDPLLTRLIAAAKTSNNSDLHFALGSAFNQLTQYELAWQHFSRANALERGSLPPYDREKIETWFNRIRTQCDHEWFTRIRATSSEPVFICGMFRTGSTLLEQILAAHPAFTPGGEREFFPRLVLREFHEFPDGLDQTTPGEINTWRKAAEQHARQITGETTRLTDKRPDNFLYIGLIKAVLPSAKFVVTERDWRDTALSIFTTRLGSAQNYSTDLSDIRHYIALQKQLVDHWKSMLGDDLLRIAYEDLVSEPRETVGKLLQQLGEDWDDRCLAFDKLDNAVKTASVWQVREPLHSKSIGRWRNYQAYFEAAFGTDSGAWL